MLATSDPDRIDIAFDDDRLVADAGLLLRPRSPSISVCKSSPTVASTSVTRRGGRTPATSC